MLDEVSCNSPLPSVRKRLSSSDTHGYVFSRFVNTVTCLLDASFVGMTCSVLKDPS